MCRRYMERTKWRRTFHYTMLMNQWKCECVCFGRGGGRWICGKSCKCLYICVYDIFQPIYQANIGYLLVMMLMDGKVQLKFESTNQHIWSAQSTKRNRTSANIFSINFRREHILTHAWQTVAWLLFLLILFVHSFIIRNVRKCVCLGILNSILQLFNNKVLIAVNANKFIAVLI